MLWFKYQLLLSQKNKLLCPIIYLKETQNRLLLSQKSPCSVPKFVLLWPWVNFSCPKNWPRSVPYFISLWHNINFSCSKSHLVLSHNSSRYDSISYSLVPKSHPVCPIICHVMTQYQLLLSQKITFLCSIIHLVMTWYQFLLSNLVRSCFIIVKIMFSPNYWC